MSEPTGDSSKTLPRSNGIWLIVVLMVIVSAVLIWRPAPSGDGFRSPDQRKPPGLLLLATLDGKPWKVEDHLGKVVVINFWATWCPPCVTETPALVRVANRFAGDDFAMVGVNFDEGPPELVLNFIAAQKIPYPTARVTAITPTLESMVALPVTMLIDRQGRVARMWMGEVTERELVADIERVRAEAR